MKVLDVPRHVAIALAAVLLAACAGPATDATGQRPFHDALFAPASVPIEPDEAMALSPAMHAYLDARIRRSPPGVDRRRWLMQSLYQREELQLEYDASLTRTAAQAFEARSGNCLALVMMTGAFAQAMGLTVRYQQVLGDDAIDRAGDLAISIGHVNLTLDDQRPRLGGLMSTDKDPWVVDFLPSSNTRAQLVRTIMEPTVIAMYLNNRAVESLVRGRADDAYWFIRKAIRRDPELMSAYVTLGLIYRFRQAPALAEATLRRVAEREPDNTQALANRVVALRDLGRHADAEALQRRLDRLDPHPHFSDFRLGQVALRERRFEDARRLFAQEVARSPDYHEFRFWLAVAYAELNDPQRAAEQLARAKAVSTTRKDHDLYAAKLDKLKAAVAARPGATLRQ